jgi:DNA-binding NarL/FixJ family response regulator
LEIVAEAADGEEAVQKAKIDCPDLAILDIEMPRKNGIQAAREIISFCPNTAILADSLNDVRTFAGELKEAGIRGFVSKDSLARDLIPAIDAVINGQTAFAPND